MSEEVDSPRGFEPRLTDSESVVLPLDDGAIRRARDRNRRRGCQRRSAPFEPDRPILARKCGPVYKGLKSKGDLGRLKRKQNEKYRSCRSKPQWLRKSRVLKT